MLCLPWPEVPMNLERLFTASAQVVIGSIRWRENALSTGMSCEKVSEQEEEMIVGERKPFDEIKEMMKKFRKVLNVGCGGCMSIWMAGGQREVGLRTKNPRMPSNKRRSGARWMGLPLRRQCNAHFYSELDEIAKTDQCPAIDGLWSRSPVLCTVLGKPVFLSIIIFYRH